MTGWSKYPFIRLIIPFIAGIALSKYVYTLSGISLLAGVILSIALVVFLLIPSKFISFSSRWLYGIPVNLTSLLVGLVLASGNQLINISNHFANLPDTPKTYIARVIDEPVEKERSIKILLKVQGVVISGQNFDATGKVLCRIKKDSNNCRLNYGDIIIFSKAPKEPEPPGNPGEFNYKSYLEDNGIFHTIYLEEDEYKLIDSNKVNTLQAFALSCRRKLLDLFKERRMPNKELAVAVALLAGYDQLLDNNQRLEYSNAGVIHVLCVSGLHVGIIYMLAELMLGFIKRWRKFAFLRPVLIILIIWLYALITGLAPPVLRAALMFTFILSGSFLQKQSNSFNTLAAVAFILMAIDPMVLFNIGFQLSFAAVAGIKLFHPLMNKLWQPTNPGLKYTWDMITVSTAAQLATLPLILFYFHRFPTYFIIANLVAIPLSGFIIYTGLAFLVTFSIPLVGNAVYFILVLLIRFLNQAVAYIDNLPGAVVKDIYMSVYAGVVLLALIVFIFLFIRSGKKSYIMAVMICGVILAGNATIHHIRTHNQKMIIFHKSSGHPLVSFISGHNQTVLSDSTAYTDNTKVGYQLNGLNSLIGINSRTWHQLSNPVQLSGKYINRVPEFYSFGGKRLVIISGPGRMADYKNNIRIDYVLLCRNPWLSPEQLKQNFPGAIVIADNTCSRKMVNKYKQETAGSDIRFYDLNEQGALVIDLNF